MLSDQIDLIVDDALEAAVRHIQDAIGVTTGDRAALFFTGKYAEEITRRLRQYTIYELNCQELDR